MVWTVAPLIPVALQVAASDDGSRGDGAYPMSGSRAAASLGARRQRYPALARRAVLNWRWYAAGLMDSSLANTRRKLS
jgi:hypothetical protein